MIYLAVGINLSNAQVPDFSQKFFPGAISLAGCQKSIRFDVLPIFAPVLTEYSSRK